MKKLLIGVASALLLLAFSDREIVGIASYYSSKFEGRKTANGERYKGKGMTAASNLLDLNDIVEVKDVLTHKTVVVKVTDRMHPSMNKKGRVIDLSLAAAKKLGIINKGLTSVSIKKF